MWKKDLELFNKVQKSFEFAKHGVVFLWTAETDVSDMWVKPVRPECLFNCCSATVINFRKYNSYYTRWSL